MDLSHSLSFSLQIFLPRPGAVEPTPMDLLLNQGFSAITSFNVSDVQSTVIVSARPNQNISLQLLLSQTYNSNISSAKQNTILTGKG